MIMEDKETLLFEVKLDIPGIKEKAELARAAIATLRAEKKATDKEFADKTIGATEYAKSMQVLDTHLARAQGQLKSYTKTLADNEKATKAADGSNDQLRAKLALLVPQLNAMGKAQRETSTEGVALAAQVKALSDEIKSNMEAVGDHRMSVGDYAKANRELVVSITSLKKELSDLETEYNNLSVEEQKAADVGGVMAKAIKKLKDELQDSQDTLNNQQKSTGDYIKQIKIAGTTVGEMEENVKSGYQAFKVFTSGISLARGGLIALGAVPILIFLTGLVLLFQRSQGAMDKLAQYFKAGELALSALSNGLIKNTKIIIEAFTSWDKFKNLFSDLRANAAATTSAIGDAARAGMQIAAANQRIEESEIALSVVRAKNRADIERNKKLAEDTSKSNTVRSAAAKRAYELENSTLQESLKLQKQRIANAELEYSFSKKGREDRQKVAEEQIKYSELEEDSLGKQTELNNNLNSIRQDGITKAKEAAALAAQEEIAHYEAMIILAKQKGQDTLLLEEALIKKKGAAEALETKKGSQQRKLIEVQTNAEILALRVSHAQTMWENVSAIERAQISEARAAALAGSVELENLELREAARQAEDKKKQLKADYDTQKISKARYEAELADVERNADLQKQNTRNQFAAERINKDAELAKLLIDIEQNTNEKFLETRRNQATAVIDLEEKQQLDLLALQELGRKERQTREDAITAEAAAKRKEVYRQIQADQRADKKAGIEIDLAGSKEGSRQEFEAQKQLLRLQRDEELANTELSEKQKAAIRAKYAREEADMEKARRNQMVDKIVDYANQSIGAISNIFEAQANLRTKLLEDQESGALKSAGLSAEAREKIQQKFDIKREEEERKAAERRRKIALVEAVINTAAAVIKASPNVFLMALAGLTGLAQISVIESQKFARGGVIDDDQVFGRGGEVEGPSHAQGGVKFRVGRRTVELEGGEGVVNKRSMAMPGVRERVSALNVMGGGVPFKGIAATTYTPMKMEFGGIVSGASGGSTVDYVQMTNMVVSAVASLPAPIVQVGAIRSSIGKQVRVENRADIGV